MQPEELLERLLELARDAELEVRSVPGAPLGGGEGAAPSAVCRVRGDVWVVLSAADPLERRIDVLARALATHAPALLESRYLPPALRERLRASSD